MISVMGTIFPIIFVVVAGIVIFVLIKGIMQWNSNNQQPVLSVAAKVVSKRTDVRKHTHQHENHQSIGSSTYYYVTFEVESGDRMELAMSGNEFGMLAEGDYGKLTFQGTRYKGFDRDHSTGGY
ncbi:DUF2500 domain-containing protein [Paenibacillus albiflavus]|uniref:DUF2500 domain-containing protein n=2 Tax=Paenibacillus albiflavus TaxID=2545760 RepID=A0A4R4E006_9BACL|nr:DUF2500 domain-containing protein [Paenibacillus albiflavus]TCZ70559.1 DUF2500 domain-containing protein [Paenibacillus albiflavus]